MKSILLALVAVAVAAAVLIAADPAPSKQPAADSRLDKVIEQNEQILKQQEEILKRLDKIEQGLLQLRRRSG